MYDSNAPGKSKCNGSEPIVPPQLLVHKSSCKDSETGSDERDQHHRNSDSIHEWPMVIVCIVGAGVDKNHCSQEISRDPVQVACLDELKA